VIPGLNPNIPADLLGLLFRAEQPCQSGDFLLKNQDTTTQIVN
jgi:hypothetical protein